MPSIKITDATTKLTRKITVKDDAEWSTIEEKIRAVFGLPDSTTVAVTYTDSDGDVISISSTAEFHDLLSTTQPGATIRFVLGDASAVSTKDSTTESEAEPVVESTPVPETTEAQPSGDVEMETAASAIPPSEINSEIETFAPVREVVETDKTSIEDITTEEYSHEPSGNGPVDQRSILEEADPATEAATAAPSPSTDASKPATEAETPATAVPSPSTDDSEAPIPATEPANTATAANETEVVDPATEDAHPANASPLTSTEGEAEVKDVAEKKDDAKSSEEKSALEKVSEEVEKLISEVFSGSLPIQDAVHRFNAIRDLIDQIPESQTHRVYLRRRPAIRYHSHPYAFNHFGYSPFAPVAFGNGCGYSRPRIALTPFGPVEVTPRRAGCWC